MAKIFPVVIKKTTVVSGGSGMTDAMSASVKSTQAETIAAQVPNQSFFITDLIQETNASQSETIKAGVAGSGFADSNSEPDQGMTVVAKYTVSGAQTWVCPTGITSITVECWAGGAGGTNGTATNGGQGGGGGAYSRSVQTVTPGNTYNLSVGAGGTSNNAGNDSWFGSTTTVFAQRGFLSGSGGFASNGFGTTKFGGGNGGAGGAAVGGGGGGGGAGNANNGNGGISGAATGNAGGGAGGTNGGGTGGSGGAGTAGGAGNTANLLSGGGGGGGFSATSPGSGGSGARGEVRITWVAA